MARDQRIKDNFALKAAQEFALEKRLPLAVIFSFHTVSTSRAFEHYEFMLKGLREVSEHLAEKNIPFIGLVGDSSETLPMSFKHFNPAMVFFDMSPLNGPKKLVSTLSKEWPVTIVDTHNVVPVWEASDKQEYGARTIRPKIHKLLNEYSKLADEIIRHPFDWPNKNILTFSDIENKFLVLLEKIPRNNVTHFPKSGESAALKEMHSFFSERFNGYANNRNDPTINGLSNLSPYFHYGQLSTLRVMNEAQSYLANNSALQSDYDALIEEMIVRKELSDNFCYYNSSYKIIGGAPLWAQATLRKHQSDKREFLYTKEQFEDGGTHDQAWNAAQIQLRKTGKMHGYMRMYWAKKILEWSATPEEAIQTLIYLNDFYSLDGGDPSGYVGILWSVAGLHDRPWGERLVYGTIRSMVYDGLKRKFAIEEYIKQQGIL
jgi:deoxyribodipyrimidine photo-lyase